MFTTQFLTLSAEIQLLLFKFLNYVNFPVALSKGMELIPCIQTLAHMNAIIRWPAYREHVDTDDILLAGDKAVYELIDKMFATIPIRSIMIKCLLPTQRLRRIPGLLVAFGTGRDSHLIMATV